MTIGLDHVIVPSHNRLAGAKFLAGLLDVPGRNRRSTSRPSISTRH